MSIASLQHELSTPETSGQKKTMTIETWGCQMNIQDSESMLAVLSDEYSTTDDLTNCDLVILNTCHIREKSTHKVMSRLGHLRILKQQSPRLQVAVAGCVAQAEAKKLSSVDGVDVVVGPGRISEISGLLKQAKLTGSTQVALGFPSEIIKAPFQKKSSSLDETSGRDHIEQYASSTVHHGKNPISRFLTIQKGCDNYCTFCIVPHTRGKEISYPPHKVIAGVQRYLDMGAREICLLGQNVNSYGADLVREGWPVSEEGAFCDLLRSICKIPRNFRVRFTTSNPHDLTSAMGRVFAQNPKLGRYYHLPVQSGSDAILARMKRKVTRSEYLTQVAMLRAQIPDMALSTDIIVGFPGETEQDFEDTCSLIEEVGFSFIYAFAYSPRKKTPASRMPDQIPESLKKHRLQTLFKIQNKITQQSHHQEVGQIREILVLYESQKQPHSFYGRTQQFRLVKITVPPHETSPVGEFVWVQITKASLTCLEGGIIT